MTFPAGILPRMTLPPDTPVPDVPSSLANELARERNREAADRTLLAWIRTSLAMISFGFGIERLGQAAVGFDGTARRLLAAQDAARRGGADRAGHRGDARRDVGAPARARGAIVRDDYRYADRPPIARYMGIGAGGGGAHGAVRDARRPVSRPPAR